MKARLLTALVAAGCFSQMAVAAVADDTLTTGDITNKTTATATLNINQPVTLENTLTPEPGVRAGLKSDGSKEVVLATGKLAIKEAGAKARLALLGISTSRELFETYAAGHEGDDEYKLSYVVSPNDRDDSYSTFTQPDGEYFVKKNAVNSINYSVLALFGTPKAGNYVISATGAVYNP